MSGSRNGVSSTVLALALIGGAPRLEAVFQETPVQGENVKVVGASQNTWTISLGAERNKTKVNLDCTKTMADCRIPDFGPYLMVEARGEEHPYTHCLNVYLYSYDSKGNAGKKVGWYCLIEP